MKYVIGGDLGTSALKLILVNQNGEVVKEISKEYPLYIDENNGYSEQDPLDWKNALISGVKEIISGLYEDVVAISLDGQMHGLVSLDSSNNIIRNALLWNDNRSKKECDYLNNEIGKDFLLENTGNIAYTGFTLPKLLWVKNNEIDNYNKIDKILLPKDYLNFIMTGKKLSDPSDACGTLLFDVKNKKWSSNMCKKVNINENILPEILSSSSLIGQTSEEFNKEVNLNHSINVYMGGGDNALSAIGNGIVCNGDCNISLGTSGTILIATDSYYNQKEGTIHSFSSATNKYCQLACMLSSASSLKWLNDQVFKLKDYNLIQKEIQEKDILNNNLYFLPYLVGERSPINDPYAKGTYIGLNPNTGRKEMTIALFEGVSFTFKDSFETLKEMGINIQESTLTGGGARSEIWCEILASVLNINLNIVNDSYGPSFGSALLALYGEKYFTSFMDIKKKFIKIKKTIKPNDKIVIHYKEKYQKYKKIYPALKNIFPLI